MKIIRADYFDPHEGNIVGWFRSEKEAYAKTEQMRNEHNQPDFEWHKVSAVEIPTSKAGLLNWLNANFNRDNG